MSTATIARNAITDSLDDVQGAIVQTARRFWMQHGCGGEWEEMRATAMELFLDAYHSFDPGKGSKLLTWTVNRVHWGLLERHRKEARFHARFPRVPMPSTLSHTPCTSYQELLMDLEGDAKRIVLLLRAMPNDLQSLMQTKRPPRKALQIYLRQNGWSMSRITKAFDRIQEVIA